MSGADDRPYDVFVSYAREDTTRAVFIANQLEAKRLRVFFDTEGIESGDEFPLVIDRAIKGAKCVLALWSRVALEKRWVRLESRIGLDHRKLVAAMLDGTRPEDLPTEFYNVNVDNLSDFYGDANHAAWNRVLRAIGRRTGRQDLIGVGPDAPAPSPRSYSAPPDSTPRAAGGLPAWAPIAAVFGLVVLLGGGYLMMRDRQQSSAPPAAVEEASVEPNEKDAAEDAAAQEARVRLEARLEGACSSGDISACRRYLEQFSASAFASEARARIARAETPAAPVAPVAADLSGGWTGRYFAGGNRDTPFQLDVTGVSGRFRGRMTEINTFASAQVARLFADVEGVTAVDGSVTFTKTYDGTGGVSHSVRYEGRINAEGDTITGVWRINQQEGRFEMRRR